MIKIYKKLVYRYFHIILLYHYKQFSNSLWCDWESWKVLSQNLFRFLNYAHNNASFKRYVSCEITMKICIYIIGYNKLQCIAKILSKFAFFCETQLHILMLRKDERVEELFDRLIIILRHLKKRPNRKLVLTVRDKFPFVLDAKVSAFLSDKKWAEHFSTLCTVPYADTCQRPCTKPVYIEIYFGRLVFVTDNV